MAAALTNADQDLITDTRREAWEQGRQAGILVLRSAAARMRATFGARGGNAIDRHTADNFENQATLIQALANPH